jgi:hypothetical protein
MARYGKESKLSPVGILEKAVEFFGPGGEGLKVKSRDERCVRLEDESGYGYVFIQVCKKEKSAEVTLETREWDFQVKQFMGEI